MEEIIKGLVSLAPVVGGPIGMLLGASEKSHKQEIEMERMEQDKVKAEIQITDAKMLAVHNAAAWLRKFQKIWWSLVLGISFMGVTFTNFTTDPEGRAAVLTLTTLVVGHFFGRR